MSASTLMRLQTLVMLVILSQCWLQVNAQNQEVELEGTGIIATRHPYMASIRNYGRFDCGGVLIGTHIVLTSARCVDPRYDRSELPEIWLNNTRTFEPSATTVFRKAIEVRVHPLYSGDIYEGYDFALLLLNESAHELVHMTRFPWHVPVQDGAPLAILGFGRSSGTDAVAPALQIGQLTLVSPEVCHNSEDIVFIEDQMRCVEGDVPCNGDQGGPIFRTTPGGGDARTDYLMGIISIAGCEYNHRVAAFLSTHNENISNWIDNQSMELEALIPEEHLPPDSDCTADVFAELAQGSEVAWDEILENCF